VLVAASAIVVTIAIPATAAVSAPIIAAVVAPAITT